MSEASSLVLAFRAHLIETLELAGVQRNAIEELCVEHERLLEFVRAECFALSEEAEAAALNRLMGKREEQ